MSIKNQRDRDTKGHIKKQKRSNDGPPCPYGRGDWEWRNKMMNRPKRRANKSICKQVMKGADPDGLAGPLGNCKPHVYYW